MGVYRNLLEGVKQKDTRKKILITLALLLVYRLGAFIPIPGIEPSYFQGAISESGAENFLNLLNSIAGGALAQGAILALGVGPYITSSIVMQLLTVAIPALKRLSEQGDHGRRKIAVITRYAALLMALAQAIAIVVALGVGGNLQSFLFGGVPQAVVAIIVIIVLTAGSMFTVFIGDKITEHGIGNGMSMLIFVGIISTGVGAFFSSLIALFQGELNQLITISVFIVTLTLIFFFVVFVDLAERRIPITYAKQVKGNKMYGGQNANIPIKINALGVMPIMFSFAILQFPEMIMTFFAPGSGAQIWYSANMGSGSWPNIILTALFILGFSYFYASLIFNPQDVARQIQQNGGFILGFRPGLPTQEYIKKVHNRITLFGALFLMFMALIPSIIFRAAMGGSENALTTAFTSIGILIIVSVALEFDKQLQAQMMMKSYKGFLK